MRSANLTARDQSLPGILAPNFRDRRHASKRSRPCAKDFGMSPRFRPTMIVLPKKETNHVAKSENYFRQAYRKDTVELNINCR